VSKLQVENIVEISPNKEGRGYFIHFIDGRKIWITKRRTIPALLILIKYGDACEADLQRGSTRLPKIKQLLEGKIPPNYIQDSYADANKPFSELWNEEGFVWIENKAGDKRLGSQRYILYPEDHERFFQGNIKKAHRQAPKVENKDEIRQHQNGLCNICGAKISPRNQVSKNSFSRDRLREVFDHRVPVEKSGKSETANFQALCFYCNKSKWQICTICDEKSCSSCALAFPEKYITVKPTGENIQDRMKSH
jgi:HNH endonuclease